MQPDPVVADDQAAVGRLRWMPQTKVLAAAAMWATGCIVAFVVLEGLHTPRTFFFDEWSFVLGRRSGGLTTFLEPHNGHLSALPVLSYRIFFGLFGLDRYLPYRFAGLLTHLAVASLVVLYVRKRLGDIAALSAGAVVLMLGVGWQNIVWPFQIGFMGSLAGAIGAWLLLDRRTRRADALASASLMIALMCSGLGIAILAGTTVRLAAERSWRRMVSVLAVPVVLYDLWYVAYGESQGSSDNIGQIPEFVIDSATASAGGIVGPDPTWGPWIVGAMLLLGVGLVAVKRWPAVSVLAPTTCVVANWTLTGYSRARTEDPAASRYVYVGAILVLLIAADILKPIRGRLLYPVAVAVAILGVWGNWSILHRGASSIREASAVTSVELRALEWARETVPSIYQPDTALMPQISAGPYFDAIGDLGSPAATDGEVIASTSLARIEVDRVSIEALGIRLDPSVPTPPSSNPTSGQDLVVEAGTCMLVVPTVESPSSILVTSGQPLSITPADLPVEIRVLRFADTFPDDALAVVSPGDAGTLIIPPDMSPTSSWLIELRTDGAANVCS